MDPWPELRAFAVQVGTQIKRLQRRWAGLIKKTGSERKAAVGSAKQRGSSVVRLAPAADASWRLISPCFLQGIGC